MLRAALHVINFIADVATGAPSAAAFPGIMDEVCPTMLLLRLPLTAAAASFHQVHADALPLHLRWLANHLAL